MMQYENDDRAILRVLDGLAEGQIIDHGTARAIAAQYNEPGICESFVSTGAIPSGENDGPDSFTLIYALFDGTAEHPEYGLRAAKALEEYIEDRNEAGDFAPVDGWSDMWVPKHVDYPHETGALDACWCYEGADDSERSCGCGGTGVHGVDHDD
jgi:hypothetical protein